MTIPGRTRSGLIGTLGFTGAGTLEFQDFIPNGNRVAFYFNSDVNGTLDFYRVSRNAAGQVDETLIAGAVALVAGTELLQEFSEPLDQVRVRFTAAGAGQVTGEAVVRVGEADLPTAGYGEVTAQTTTAAALEDIPGLTFDLVLRSRGRIIADMAVQCDAAGAVATGGWAISINGVDGAEIRVDLTVGAKRGVSVQTRSAVLAAGTYTVKGRHYRAAGAGTVGTDVAQLSALVVG
jgi:hypothetical protein